MSAEAISPEPLGPRSDPPPAPVQLRFTGSGGEYFRIWIVNLLLTIVTLGIYSAWAKVRRLKYFYRNTELAGTGFEYHGRPLSILLGRVVAVSMFLAYKYSFRFSVPLGLAVLAVLLLIAPWLVRSSLRFRLYNSSYRGLRFGFDGSLGGAYLACYSGLLMLAGLGIAVALMIASLKMLVDVAALKPLAGIAGIVAVGTVFFLIYPAWYHQFKHYQHSGARYGQSAFSFHATLRQFAWIFFLTFAILFGMFAAGGFVMAALGSSGNLAALAPQPGHKPDPKALTALLPFLGAFYLGLLLVIGPFFRARIDNLIWNQTRLADHRFESRLTVLGLFALYATNLIGILLTLGFYAPWAMVRTARYRAERLTVVPSESFDTLISGQRLAPGAIGEEATGLFDFDIAL